MTTSERGDARIPMVAWAARALLARVAIIHEEVEGYTHDLAADLLGRHGDHRIIDVFQIIADERGAGPVHSSLRLQDRHRCTRRITVLGGEEFRFQSDGGIELWPLPDEAKQIIQQKLLDAAKRPTESSQEGPADGDHT